MTYLKIRLCHNSGKTNSVKFIKIKPTDMEWSCEALPQVILISISELGHRTLTAVYDTQPDLNPRKSLSLITDLKILQSGD